MISGIETWGWGETFPNRGFLFRVGCLFKTLTVYSSSTFPTIIASVVPFHRNLATKEGYQLLFIITQMRLCSIIKVYEKCVTNMYKINSNALCYSTQPPMHQNTFCTSTTTEHPITDGFVSDSSCKQLSVLILDRGFNGYIMGRMGTFLILYPY